jgi:nucleoside-diphosphate-sugar epimerase
MREVLVTGANGFVGSHICEALIKSGYSVRALVRKTSDLANLKDLTINLAYGDITDPNSLADAVKDIYAIVNNAGLVKTNCREQFQQVNCGGTENVLKAALENNPGSARFVHVSSTAACGPAPSMAPIDEEYPPNPLTAYGRSKLNAERAVLAFKSNIPVTILRPSAVYGPRDTEMYSFFKSIRMRVKPAFGPGQRYLNFTYVKDFARAVVSAIETETPSGGIYIVAEKKPHTYSEAADIIAKILGKSPVTLYVPGTILSMAGWFSENIARWRSKPSIFTQEKVKEILQRYWIFDTSRVERDLGFVSTDFETGAGETIAWYKENGWL